MATVGCEIVACQVPNGRLHWGTGMPKIFGLLNEKENGNTN